MPRLVNPRYEAFARARANGARLDDAFEDAGFVLHRGHPSRLARRPDVAGRIAELRANRNEEEDIDPRRAIAALLRIAKAGEASPDPRRVREARLALIDAARLHAAAAAARHREQTEILEESEAEAAAGGSLRLPETCLQPARPRHTPAARLPFAGPPPASRLPLPALDLPGACLEPATAPGAVAGANLALRSPPGARAGLHD